eukprot:gene31873-7081_t
MADTTQAVAGGQASIAPFLRKAWDIVEDSENAAIVSWNPAGNSLVVHDAEAFSREILPKSFKHNNFSSFVRQLNTYGFRKSDPDKWEFTNEYFVRWDRDLMSFIQRRKTAGVGGTGATGASNLPGNVVLQPNAGTLNLPNMAMMMELAQQYGIMNYQQGTNVEERSGSGRGSASGSGNGPSSGAITSPTVSCDQEGVDMEDQKRGCMNKRNRDTVYPGNNRGSKPAEVVLPSGKDLKEPKELKEPSPVYRPQAQHMGGHNARGILSEMAGQMNRMIALSHEIQHEATDEVGHSEPGQVNNIQEENVLLREDMEAHKGRNGGGCAESTDMTMGHSAEEEGEGEGEGEGGASRGDPTHTPGSGVTRGTAGSDREKQHEAVPKANVNTVKGRGHGEIESRLANHGEQLEWLHMQRNDDLVLQAATQQQVNGLTEQNTMLRLRAAENHESFRGT